jgi:methionine aminotransferase
MQITSKLPNTGTNIFTVMSALAAEYGAVNLGQGFPDFPMNPELIELVADAMRTGNNQYAPMAGLIGLRESIAEKVEKIYGTSVHPDKEITITPGATYAIYTALTALLHPGDEVIIFEPAYDSYIPNIEANGAVAVPVPLRSSDYRIDWEKVRGVVKEKTKAILINSPHNPTGTVLDTEDIQCLHDLVREKNIFIISDEVYEHLVFDGKNHQSILKYPELYARSFVCFSFGKTYSCTGWKLGYCIAPSSLTTEFRKIHQFNAFTCNTPMQIALAKFLKDPSHYLYLGKDMQDRRDYFLQQMQSLKELHFLPSSGSYFVCADYSGVSDLPDHTFAKKLTKEAGVATIPLSAFYSTPIEGTVLRFCFCKDYSTLAAAAQRLSNFFSAI